MGMTITMPDAAWKAWERRVASIFGGRRRGPDTRSPEGGRCDVTHEFWAPEVKLLGRPGYADLLSAALQAERNAGPTQCAVAVVKKKHSHDADALVVFRLENFREWFV